MGLAWALIQDIAAHESRCSGIGSGEVVLRCLLLLPSLCLKHRARATSLSETPNLYTRLG